ncbi:MAG: sulfatase-like hydrolase/transferase [Acidimicrobiales bacterium]
MTAIETTADDAARSTAAGDDGAAGGTGPTEPNGASRWRRELRAFAELLAACGFALAQPLLDIFGRAPDQFIFRGATRRDVLAFGLIVTFAAPIALWVVEVVVGLASTSARRRLHVAVLGSLAAVFAVGALASALPGWPKVVVGVGIGVGFAALYVRTRGARIWLAFASFAPPAFLAIFLLASQVAPLLERPAGTLDVTINEPAPVVVVVFDELPLASLIDQDGQLDADLFPNFARLAGTATWFPDATTVSNFTWNAVPAIATGDVPEDGLTPTAADHPNNLFTLLGGAMPVQASESITRLCPSTVCDASLTSNGRLRGLLGDAKRVMVQRLSPRPDETDPVAGLVDEESGGDDASASAAEDHTDETEGIGGALAEGQSRFGRFRDGLADPATGLHYLHILLPHIPFRYLPDGTTYPGPDPDLGRPTDVWDDQPTLVDLARQRHLLQLQYADALLGQALDSLESSGRFDDALVVVTADHGTAFVPGEDIRGINAKDPLDPTAGSQILWVPMLVKAPGQTEGVVSDRQVKTIDVLPTVADVLDIDLPWEPDGRSMLSGPARTGDTRSMYIAQLEGTSVARGEPFEIDADDGWRRVLDSGVDAFAPASGGVRGSDRLLRLGPRPDLWGEPAADHDDELEPIDATLGPDYDPSDVDPSSGRVPALVRAEIPQAKAGDEVAVIIGGRIWATTRAYDEGEGARVAAIVSDAAFAAGDNPTTFALIR